MVDYDASLVPMLLECVRWYAREHSVEFTKPSAACARCSGSGVVIEEDHHTGVPYEVRCWCVHESNPVRDEYSLDKGGRARLTMESVYTLLPQEVLRG